ncbi:MAG: helix-turn-helix transcriptional regulator [Oscillospiraceae bacterium]|nr:helix-turn-helix transcriptional regulator [Oscillospiraceae bacterium]
MHAFVQSHELSSREIEVLSLISEGASNGEISAKLFISGNTVKFHVHNI